MHSKFNLPSELDTHAQAFEVSLRSEDLQAAHAAVNRCIAEFKSTERTPEEARQVRDWLVAAQALVRLSRQHIGQRLVELRQPHYSTAESSSPAPGSGWVGIIALAFLLLPTHIIAGDQQTAMARQEAAAKRQRDATKIQTSNGSFFQTAWTESMPQSTATSVPAAGDGQDCPELSSDELNAMISRMSLGPVSPKLVNAVIAQESGGKPCAVSSKGAMGLMQIMPDLASDMKLEDPFDAEQNLRAGIRYLSQLSERYKGDLRLMLAAYNAGPARVDAIKDVPDIAETQAYVKSILSKIRPVE